MEDPVTIFVVIECIEKTISKRSFLYPIHCFYYIQIQGWIGKCDNTLRNVSLFTQRKGLCSLGHGFGAFTKMERHPSRNLIDSRFELPT